jgi:hypothetical protein
MKIRACRPGERMKPVRVLLEKDGNRYGGPVTIPEGFLPPTVGEEWDEKHVVVGARSGINDDTWDEVLLTIQEKKP